MKLADIKSRDEYRLVSLIKKKQDEIDEMKEKLDFKKDLLRDLYNKAQPYYDEESMIFSKYPPNTKPSEYSHTHRKKLKRLNKELSVIHVYMQELDQDIDDLHNEIKELEDDKRRFELQLADLRKTDSRTKREMHAEYRKQLKLQEPF